MHVIDYKLPVYLSGYFLWFLLFFCKSPIFNYLVSLIFKSSTGLIVMILGFCISDSTAAVHSVVGAIFCLITHYII